MSDYHYEGDGCYRREPKAVRVARLLHSGFGRQALETAEGRLTEAVLRGELPQADLYVAVCAILLDHQAVFSRLVRNECGTRAIPERPETLYRSGHADPAFHSRRGADRGA